MSPIQRLILSVVALLPLAAQAQAPAAAAPAQPHVVGIEFIGRMVANLDRSVAFYKAIGFAQDPLTNPVWREDPVLERLYGAHGIQSRMAKMFINSNISGKRFVVYLREVKGIRRRNLSGHTAWDPGSTHFGLVVADAEALWSELRAKGLLHPRSWDGKLVPFPGETQGGLAYITDPDGLDIEIINQRPAVPAAEGRPARAAVPPGVSHVGLIVLDSDKACAFYGDLFGGQLQSQSAPWMKGDFTDSVVGGHGNVLRFHNEAFAEVQAPASHMNLELVEFQNRKKPVEKSSITDIGLGYVGFEVQGLDAFLERVRAAGAKMVSAGIATMKSGTRVVMVRDPDVGMYIELFEQPGT